MNKIKNTEMATRFIAIDLVFAFHKIPFVNFAFVYCTLFSCSRRLSLMKFCVSFEFRFCELIFAIVWTCHTPPNDSSAAVAAHSLFEWNEMKVILLLFAAAATLLVFDIFFRNVKTAWWNYTLIAIS